MYDSSCLLVDSEAAHGMLHTRKLLTTSRCNLKFLSVYFEHLFYEEALSVFGHLVQVRAPLIRMQQQAIVVTE